MARQPVPYLTPEQYLAIDREAEFRHEYHDGEMFLTPGASLNHARIVRNALRHIDIQTTGRGCEAVSNDLRLWSKASGAFMYPDIVITCGSPRFLDARRDTITDAKVVIEVLSPSTRNFDRGEKFAFYRSLDSLTEYLLIAQHRMGAELYVRQADRSWVFREFTSGQDEISLSSIGCKLKLHALYDRVEFEL